MTTTVLRPLIASRDIKLPDFIAYTPNTNCDDAIAMINGAKEEGDIRAVIMGILDGLHAQYTVIELDEWSRFIHENGTLPNDFLQFLDIHIRLENDRISKDDENWSSDASYTDSSIADSSELDELMV